MFSPISRLKLRHKLMLAMLTLVLVMIFVMLYLLYSRQKQLILEQVKERSIDLTTIISFSGVRAFLENNYLELQELIDGIGNREDVQQAMVLSPEGKVLVHSRTAEVGKIYPDHPRRAPDGSNTPVCITNKEVLDVTTPIIVAGNQVAFSRTIISLKTANMAINEMGLSIGALGIISIVIAMALAFVLARQVTKPLQQLHLEAQKISQGAREVKIEVTAQDEIGTLQQALKIMVEEVRLRSRLAALGVIMANLSHEIKNPLLAISKYLHDFAIKSFPQNGEAELRAARHAKVLDEVNQLNDLVKNLLMFSQNRKLILSHANVNDLIDQALFILDAPLKERKIDLTPRLETTLPAISADKNFLKSVFVNLISNAIEAMETGGALLIQTRLVAKQQPPLPTGKGLPLPLQPLSGWRKIRLRRLSKLLQRFLVKPKPMAEKSPAAAQPPLVEESSPGDWRQKTPMHPLPLEKDAIEITIADNGRGIREEIMDQLFLPFVTDKEKGTGLGLAHSYKVIQEHGGTIRVQSKVGQGTTFTITLPA